MIRDEQYFRIFSPELAFFFLLQIRSSLRSDKVGVKHWTPESLNLAVQSKD